MIIVCDKIKNDENKYSTVYMWKSVDDGLSWSEPIIIKE